MWYILLLRSSQLCEDSITGKKKNKTKNKIYVGLDSSTGLMEAMHSGYIHMRCLSQPIKAILLYPSSLPQPPPVPLPIHCKKCLFTLALSSRHIVSNQKTGQLDIPQQNNWPDLQSWCKSLGIRQAAQTYSSSGPQRSKSQMIHRRVFILLNFTLISAS